MSNNTQAAGTATNLDIAIALANIRASRELALANLVAQLKIRKTKKP